MAKRYQITLHRTGEGNEYDIEHEADRVLVGIASYLYYGDPEAQREWEPYAEVWPELMDIEENEDGAADFEMLRHFDDDPDRWPGRQAFWSDAMHSGVPGVNLSGQGFPGGTELLLIEEEESLQALKSAMAEKYEFIHGDPWV